MGASGVGALVNPLPLLGTGPVLYFTQERSYVLYPEDFNLRMKGLNGIERRERVRGGVRKKLDRISCLLMNCSKSAYLCECYVCDLVWSAEKMYSGSLPSRLYEP